MNNYEAVINFIGSYATAFEAEDRTGAERIALDELKEIFNEFPGIELEYAVIQMDTPSDPKDLPEEF